jgi:hypothetical protein
MELMKASDRKPIGKLPVVRNFRKVIEARDISLMNKELYQFLNLYCGFIAHYNINGFKATYRTIHVMRSLTGKQVTQRQT